MSANTTAPHASRPHTLSRAGLSVALVLALLISTGCAVLPTPSLVDRSTAPPQTIACADWYAALDTHTELAGVRDASAARIAGFPHLRVDRFTASLQDTLPLQTANPGAAAALVQRLQQLDIDARRAEIANLPPQALAQLAGSAELPPQPAQVLQKTQDCAQQLSAYHLASAGQTTSLLERLLVPDDYSTGYRLLGAYALTRYPFASGIRRFEAQRSAVFASSNSAPSSSAAPKRSRPLRLSPPAPPAGLSPTEIRRMLTPSAQDPLRIPAPTPEQAQQLLAHFAPSFQLAIDSSDDKPGALVWRQGLTADAPDRLEVDTQTPVVYSQTAYTRYGPHSLLQLVYTLWFPARPVEPGSKLDLLAGKLDGITWRVTLAPDGTPLVYDSIHPCGCYHMFFPSPAARAKPAPQPGIEWAYIPQSLPHLAAQQQLVVHVASTTHYIDRVSVEPTSAAQGTPADAAHYEWHSYDSLRSLPTSVFHAVPAQNSQPPGSQAPSQHAGGQPTRRSIFGPDGFIAGTDRGERFIFWPMGIPRAGAMRQWGKHATAFVGRRHFDDATLLQERFEFDPVHFKP
jgi:hypothetical protein